MFLQKLCFYGPLFALAGCLLLCTTMACNKQQLIKVDGIETLEIDKCVIVTDDIVVIDDAESYLALTETAQASPQCNGINPQFPSIDFAERTLIGKLTEVTGCSAIYFKEVYADPENDAYLYEITVTVESSDGCESTLQNMNWLSVPKLPEQYTVDFEVDVR